LQHERGHLRADRADRDEPHPDCERGVERDQNVPRPSAAINPDQA
jgi:hypothetical protein